MVIGYKIISFSLILATLFIALPARADFTNVLDNNPSTFLCNTLAGIISCGGTTTRTTRTNTKTTSTNSILTDIYSPLGGLFGISSKTAKTTTSTSVFGGFNGKSSRTESIVLVKVIGRSEVYRIIGGKKFMIPSGKVFNSYGFRTQDIISMSQQEILTYPRVKVIKPSNGKSIYYLTEGGMTRKIPNKTIFASYLDSEEDIVVVNSIEFSLYPKNVFIYNEETTVFGQRPTVYKIDTTLKKKVTENDLIRMGIIDSMIAPVNQTEFDYYKTVGETVRKKTSKTQTNPSPTQNVWTQYN